MSELNPISALNLAYGREQRHAFITTRGGTVYIGNFHKSILEQHRIDPEDRADAGTLVGGSPDKPAIEITVFSVEVDVPLEQEDRSITVNSIKELVSDHQRHIPVTASYY